MYAGIGCGCLAALALVAAIIIVVILVLGRDGVDTSGPTTTVPTTEEVSTRQTTEEPTTELPTTEGPTEGVVTAQDEEDAKERFLGFVRALGEGHHDDACAFMLDPFTREPFTAGTMDVCEESLAVSTDADAAEDFKTLGQVLTPDQIDAEVQDDGSIRLTVYGTEFPSPMVRAADGLWYVDFGS